MQGYRTGVKGIRKYYVEVSGGPAGSMGTFGFPSRLFAGRTLEVLYILNFDVVSASTL